MKLLRNINLVLMLITLAALAAFFCLVLLNRNEFDEILMNRAREVGMAIGLMLMFAATTVFLFIYATMEMAKEGNAGRFLKEFLIYFVMVFGLLTIYKIATHQKYVFIQTLIVSLLFPMFIMYGKMNRYLKEKGK